MKLVVFIRLIVQDRVSQSNEDSKKKVIEVKLRGDNTQNETATETKKFK